MMIKQNQVEGFNHYLCIVSHGDKWTQTCVES